MRETKERKVIRCTNIYFIRESKKKQKKNVKIDK